MDHHLCLSALPTDGYTSQANSSIGDSSCLVFTTAIVSRSSLNLVQRQTLWCTKCYIHVADMLDRVNLRLVAPIFQHCYIQVLGRDVGVLRKSETRLESFTVSHHSHTDISQQLSPRLEIHLYGYSLRFNQVYKLKFLKKSMSASHNR